MTDLVRLLRGAGLDVIDDRVAPAAGSFTPVAVMLHHTAAGTNWPVNLHIVKHGHSTLNGPLCNVYVRREGIIHVITDGRANDSGAGSPTVLGEVKAGKAVHRDARDRGLTTSSVSGNRWFYDIEIDNRGTGEPYPRPQVEAATKAAAVLLGSLGRDVGSLVYHRHWTARKPDPAHCPDLIGLTAAALTEEDDVMTPEQEARIHAKLDQIGGPVVDGRSQLLDKTIKTNIAVGRLDRQRVAIAEALPKLDQLAAASGADAATLAQEIKRALAEALSG